MGDWSRAVRNSGLRCALAVAAALAAAGCGSSGSSASSGSTAAPAAGQSAGKQVLTRAVDNLKAASSFTVSGTVGDSGGTITIHLGFRPGKGCTGTVSAAGKGTLTMVVIGKTAWVKPDDAYWKAVGGKQADKAIATFGGKYLTGPTSDSTIAGLVDFCNLSLVTSQLTQPTNVVKGQVTTINGKQALPLNDTANGGTLYVTTTSSPLPIELVDKTAGKKGTLIFNVGAPVSLTAPPAGETVEAAKYGL
ncbi:MAG TPA: hypothetical protein VHZ03_12040 [Trebonia sp.]|nr:hypothetical protein [Trebonia sp.]